MNITVEHYGPSDMYFGTTFLQIVRLDPEYTVSL